MRTVEFISRIIDIVSGINIKRTFKMKASLFEEIIVDPPQYS